MTLIPCEFLKIKLHPHSFILPIPLRTEVHLEAVEMLISQMAFQESTFMLHISISRKHFPPFTSHFIPSVLKLVCLCAGYFKTYSQPRFAVAHVTWAALGGRRAGRNGDELYQYLEFLAPALGHRARANWILPVIPFRTLPHSSQWSESQTEALGEVYFNCELLYFWN